MHMRGKSAKEIAGYLQLSQKQVRKDIEEWKSLNVRLMRESGTFSQQLTDVIAEVDQHWRMLEREAWDVIEDAKADMDRRDQLAGMKLVNDVLKARANVFGDAAKHQDEQLVAELEETAWQVEQVKRLLREVADQNPEAAELIHEGLVLISKETPVLEVKQLEEEPE